MSVRLTRSSGRSDGDPGQFSHGCAFPTGRRVPFTANTSREVKSKNDAYWDRLQYIFEALSLDTRIERMLMAIIEIHSY